MRVQLLISSLTFAGVLLYTANGSVQDDSLDAVRAAPASHHIILENERVRVLRVTIPAGATEPVHTHEWPSVMQVEAPQPLTYITYANKAGRWVEAKRFEVPAGQPVDAEWMKPEGPHAVQNRGSSEYRAIRTELKPIPAEAGASIH
jgi:hypothetical protein